MSFKDLLIELFRRNEKPQWYKNIPWYRRFGVWKSSYANSYWIIRSYIKYKKERVVLIVSIEIYVGASLF